MNYHSYMLASLPAFTINRMLTLLGTGLLFSLAAYTSPDDLAIIAYTLALFSVISGTLPMLLATSGNVASTLVNDKTALDCFFTGCLASTVRLAVVVLLGCIALAAVAPHLPGMNNLSRTEFFALSMLYLPAAPLLTINTFLHIFNEATGKALHCLKIRFCATLIGLGYLASAFTVAPSAHFKYHAMAYFLVTEAISFMLLWLLSSAHHAMLTKIGKSTARPVLRAGIPIVAGIAGQKLYFYLIIERVTATNLSIATELSIVMSVLSILATPGVALSQIHSLHTSANRAHPQASYHKGLAWTAGLTGVTAMVLMITGEHVLKLYGDSTVTQTPYLLPSIVFFISSSAFLSLATAHLRALGDTFAPQMLLALIMLALTAPIVYAINWQGRETAVLINLQAAALAMGFVLLHGRVLLSHKHHAF